MKHVIKSVIHLRQCFITNISLKLYFWTEKIL